MLFRVNTQFDLVHSNEVCASSDEWVYPSTLIHQPPRILQAKEESELPEYILGTVRLNRVRLESAAPFEVWGDLQRVCVH